MLNRFLIWIISLQLACVWCSIGDKSVAFNDCVNNCWIANCTRLSKSINLTRHDLNQPVYLKWLGWDCLEECRYNCMWFTVGVFLHEKLPVPQFYGKWPFVRILGIQEPASTVASILNLVANLMMLKEMRRAFHRRTPFKRLWYSFSGVCINTWIWSTVFHTRDVWLTELMDYFCAFGLILFQFNAFFIRWCYNYQRRQSTMAILKHNLMYVINASSVVYYLYHIHYLSSVRFDYGYNMKVNILVGVLNSICWLLWSLDKYYRERQTYVWRCMLSVVLFDVLMVFEVFDFSPIMWTFDSHALWHFSTIVFPFYWYRFIIDDCAQFDRYERID